MAFFLLGSIAVLDKGGQSLAVQGNKARALLALLLVRANCHVATDQLEDALWDGTPPPGARSTIQAHVSRLRSVLRSTNGDATLNSGAGGYKLHVDPDDLDAHRFEVLASQGVAVLEDDPRHASTLLTKALDE
jgi:DNA-binding SARP family transcriptional activator